MFSNLKMSFLPSSALVEAKSAPKETEQTKVLAGTDAKPQLKKCGICREPGHNRKTCPYNPVKGAEPATAPVDTDGEQQETFPPKEVEQIKDTAADVETMQTDGDKTKTEVEQQKECPNDEIDKMSQNSPTRTR